MYDSDPTRIVLFYETVQQKGPDNRFICNYQDPSFHLKYSSLLQSCLAYHYTCTLFLRGSLAPSCVSVGIMDCYLYISQMSAVSRRNL